MLALELPGQVLSLVDLFNFRLNAIGLVNCPLRFLLGLLRIVGFFARFESRIVRHHARHGACKSTSEE